MGLRASKPFGLPPLSGIDGHTGNGGMVVNASGVVLNARDFQEFTINLSAAIAAMGGMPATGLPVSTTIPQGDGVSRLFTLNIFDDGPATVLVPPNPIINWGGAGIVWGLDGDLRVASSFPGLTTNWMFMFRGGPGGGGNYFWIEVSRSSIAFPPP